MPTRFPIMGGVSGCWCFFLLTFTFVCIGLVAPLDYDVFPARELFTIFHWLVFPQAVTVQLRRALWDTSESLSSRSTVQSSHFSCLVRLHKLRLTLTERQARMPQHFKIPGLGASGLRVAHQFEKDTTSLVALFSSCKLIIIKKYKIQNTKYVKLQAIKGKVLDFNPENVNAWSLTRVVY